MAESVLKIKGLKTYFDVAEGLAWAVDDVSYDISRGEVVGLVGESGCGKSVSALSILRLIQSPPGHIAGGAIEFEGANILELSPKEMQAIRGNRISMIFQEPLTSLNPLFSIGHQIGESLKVHGGLDKEEALAKAVDMLGLVGIPSPRKRVLEYPHQMSGGMRQRVMIAMALACNPRLLIADEPTTALDVTIQAQILELMLGLREELGMAILMITHDLGVVAETADRVVVMYCGRVVEEAAVRV
ncbi:MAG: ABC transporter ATP-binding protein, partial [Deltaproteobacteria bacterium]|nr:ABC transporter ATP-binding protein [Deltaproteobacteria bacterium]